jgi:integrase
MSIFKRGSIYWYKFNWQGESVRETTRQGNARVARQIEAAHKVSLAKGEVGIREKKPVPTLKAFAENDFLPFVRSTFAKKPKTLLYYENGVKNLLNAERLSGEKLDDITTDKISDYVRRRQSADGKCGRPLQVATINRELQVLRRIFTLAQEWRRVERVLPKVSMLPGERHRERVLTDAEEAIYFRGMLADSIARCAEPALLRDVATILLDCALRPEECFRLRRENVTPEHLEILFGKTENARRRIQTTPRVKALLEMRLERLHGSPWIFPAPTKSGHIEPSTLKKAHRKAITEATRLLREETQDETAGLEPFELYTLRHTCLTRWAPHMDPWTLAYLAGHRDMNTTKRYVHPQDGTVRDAMKRARNIPEPVEGGHKSGHTPETESKPSAARKEITQ